MNSFEFGKFQIKRMSHNSLLPLLVVPAKIVGTPVFLLPTHPQLASRHRRLVAMCYSVANAPGRGVNLSVTTWGQRRQAAFPSCCHHRHSDRIAHGGSVSTTLGRCCTMFATKRHCDASGAKYPHPRQAQGAAMRKTSPGRTGFASCISSSVTGWGAGRYATSGASAVPPTTPKTRAP
jgi:hypothetical protein